MAGHRKLLGAYFAPQRGRITLLAALIAIDIALRLANPQIVRRFIDTAEAGGPLSALTLAGIAYLLIGLAARLANLAATYAGLDLGWRATNRLRFDLTSHLLRLDMPFHKTHTPGELVERVDGDVTALATFFADLAIKIAGNTLLVLAIISLLYRESTLAGILVTVYTLVVLAALAAVGRIGVQAWTAAQAAWADQMGFLEERISATEDLRGIGAESHAQKQLSALMLKLLRVARGGWMANALGFVITNFLFTVGYGMGLALGAFLYLRGDVTIGAAFLLVSYIGMLAAPLEEIRGQAADLQEATAGVHRVTELLRLKSHIPDRGAGSISGEAPSVAFHRVSFRYDDTPLARRDAAPDNVLTDVSFDLAPGRVLGILGRTGSGKTTIMRLLCRLYDPNDGEIRLDSTDLRDIPAPALRQVIGVVTQDVQLFGASVRDNITLFDESVPEARLNQALAELGLLDWVREMPQGLSTTLATGGGMSAGEAQLMAFARIFLREPGLIILDEATSRLDPVTEHRLEEAVDHLIAGGDQHRTAIVIAHRLSTVQRADDILILEAGRVVEFGARAALEADPNSRFSHLLRTGLEEVLA
jgi:ABC-type multidrug transport system fused ATPase/permease subunit